MSARPRLLITGMTPTSVGRKGRFQYDSLFDLTRGIIADLGYDCDWREVTPGEDLRAYDGAFIKMLKLSALPVLKGRYGALWAALKLPHLAFVDDWAIMDVWNSWAGRYLWRDHGGFEANLAANKAALAPYRAEVDALLDRYRRGDITLAVAAFKWGDPRAIRRYLRADRLHIFDPSPYHVPYIEPVEPAPAKERRWALGTMSYQWPWIATLGLTWPLRVIGKPAKAHIGGSSPKWQRWDERPLVREVYWPSWGMLVPPYDHAGSGWYRTRFFHAAEAGCAVIADRADTRALGGSWQLRAAEIETMSDVELRALAASQATAFRARVELSKDATRAALRAAFAVAGVPLP